MSVLQNMCSYLKSKRQKEYNSLLKQRTEKEDLYERESYFFHKYGSDGSFTSVSLICCIAFVKKCIKIVLKCIIFYVIETL